MNNFKLTKYESLLFSYVKLLYSHLEDMNEAELDAYGYLDDEDRQYVQRVFADGRKVIPNAVLLVSNLAEYFSKPSLG